jgi:hypothetical protein
MGTISPIPLMVPLMGKWYHKMDHKMESHKMGATINGKYLGGTPPLMVRGKIQKMENGKGKMAINGFPSWKFGSPAENPM